MDDKKSLSSMLTALLGNDGNKAPASLLTRDLRSDRPSLLSDMFDNPPKFLDSVAPLIAAGRVAPQEGDLAIGKGRHLDMAILFVDICGFSARPSETADEQELVLKAFNVFFPEIVRIAEEYGGTVEKNTGDGLLTWFEDACSSKPGGGTERALRAAMGMMIRNQQFVNPLLRSRGIEEITFRASIDYGPVTIANLGLPQRYHSNVAIGTKANIACKLLKFASAGQVIVGDVARTSLPQSYQSRLRLLVSDTGWEYRLNRAKYPGWVYVY